MRILLFFGQDRAHAYKALEYEANTLHSLHKINKDNILYDIE